MCWPSFATEQIVVVIQSLSRVQLFVTPWTAAHQVSLFITNSQSLLKLLAIKLVMPFNHLVLILFSSCLQSFPASGSFPMSQFFASGGPSIGASASALPMNIQDWFPLGSTGLISLQYHISINVYGRWTTVMYMLHAQLCSAISNLMDCSPPDSSVHGIFQERILEWVAVSFIRESSQLGDWTWVYIVGRFFTSEPPG